MNKIIIFGITVYLLFTLGCTLFIENAGYKENFFPSADISNGFYSDPFTVAVTAPLSDMLVCYTLDCSDPLTSPTAITVKPPVSVLIDPDSTTGGRTATPGVILRMAGKSPSAGNTFSKTYTYIFLNKLQSLSPDETSPGGDWPAQNPGTSWPDYDVQKFDYGIDPDVTGVMTQTRINNIMTAIPSISLVTEMKNLFDPAIGIYIGQNSHERGIEWERPASFEIIDPQNNAARELSVNAGLRIRGGWSRHSDNPKHAFRLFFRKEYGLSKLQFPLFENEGTTEFDKIDLRTSQNHSWSYKGSSLNIMCRDVFSRDIQRDMGQPYTRSRYYHLYLNGYYWGIFQSQERSDADYAASYFGGNPEDYDILKVDTVLINDEIYNYDHPIEVTAGNLDAWSEVWDACQTGFASNSAYYALQGKKPDGSNDPDKKCLVDINNLIDYMMIIFFTGNHDCPTNTYSQNKQCNNFFAIYNRADDSSGYKFFTHDSEHSLLYDGISDSQGTNAISAGVNENRVNIGTRGDDFEMQVTEFKYFHPQWLHFKLTENSLYRQQFANRANYLLNSGPLTVAACQARLTARANELVNAIEAESMRWGDSVNPANPPLTIIEWQTEIDRINNTYFPERHPIVTAQLDAAGLLAQGIVTQVAVKQTGTPPVIDGTLETPWDNSDLYGFENITDGQIDDDNDLSGSWRILWDAVALYLFIEVTDDANVQDSGGEQYKDDCIEIYIDTENDKDSVFDANDFVFIFESDNQISELKHGSTAGIIRNIALTGTNGNYIIEASIPWSLLDSGITPAAGNYIGIDMEINDDDDGTDRDGKRAFFETGDGAWNDASLFSTGQLE